MTGSLTDMELELLRDDMFVELDDLCKIERINTEGVLLKAGTIASESRTPLYTDLACYVAPITARRDRFDVAGGSHQFQLQYRAVIPYTATGLQEKIRIWSAENSRCGTCIGSPTR